MSNLIRTKNSYNLNLITPISNEKVPSNFHSYKQINHRAKNLDQNFLPNFVSINVQIFDSYLIFI